MRTEPDVTRVVRSWLEEGANRMPERVLDSVMELLPSTPQRRPMWLVRRLPNMNRYARAAVAAAVVIVVAVVAINVLPRSTGFGTPTVTASPTPTASPSPTAVATPTASPTASPIAIGTADKDRSLSPGRYAIGEPFALPFEITLSSAWTPRAISGGDFVFEKSAPVDQTAWLSVDMVESVFSDPCHTTSGPTPVGTLDEAVTPLTTQVGFTAGPVSDVLIGGHAGKTFVVTNSIDTGTAGCTGGLMLPLFTWTGGPATGAGTNGGATEHLWVIDVGGTIVVIDNESFPATQASDLAGTETMVQSITFDR